jgi:hypothetical protein
MTYYPPFKEDRYEPIEPDSIIKGSTIKVEFNDDKKYQTVVYTATHDGDAYGAPRKGAYFVRTGVAE